MGEVIHLNTTRPLNCIRKSQRLPLLGDEGFTSKFLNLVPISPIVYEPNPLWESHHHVCGYWFAEEPDGWNPPRALLTFLENGEAPIAGAMGQKFSGTAGSVY